MRILFFGSTEIGFRCLKRLQTIGQEIVGVFTIPPTFNISYSEKPVSAALHVDLSEWLREHSLQEFRVDGRIGGQHYLDLIHQLDPEFILVVGWYHMIPKRIYKYPRLGTALMHASLLPRYRGGAPVNWAIINGETETGITLFYVDDRYDAGDIIAQKRVTIDFHDTCLAVYQKIMAAAEEMIETCIPLIEKGCAPRIPQDESQATYVPQRRPEDGLVDWEWDALRVHNWIRAQTHPYPGAFTFVSGRKLYIWQAEPVDVPEPSVRARTKPGEVLGFILGKGMLVQTGAQRLLVRRAQFDGVAEESADQLCGRYGLVEGSLLDCSTGDGG